MELNSSNPETVVEPTTAFDKLLINMSISSVVVDNGDGTNSVQIPMSIRAVPYRVLSDGSIETREDLARAAHYGNLKDGGSLPAAVVTFRNAVKAAMQDLATAAGM